MNIYYHDLFTFPLPEGHRFPIGKYARLRAEVEQSGLGIPGENLFVPAAAAEEQLLRAHDAGYVHKVRHGRLTQQEIRRLGLPWSPELVERSRRSVGSTIAACRAALTDGAGINLAGGTHHACPDHGEGFCVFNDVAVAVRALQAEGWVRRVVIVDCDVHQGNGTAAIFHDDASVFTFSIHGEHNFPFRKVPGDLDIGLPDGAQDEAYLIALEQGLGRALDTSRPDLAIYLAGADPFAGDRLGRLSLSKAGLAERDRMVYVTCRDAGLPVATVMAGGYARDIQDVVDIHLQTIRLAADGVHAGGRPAGSPPTVT